MAGPFKPNQSWLLLKVQIEKSIYLFIYTLKKDWMHLLEFYVEFRYTKHGLGQKCFPSLTNPSPPPSPSLLCLLSSTFEKMYYRSLTNFGRLLSIERLVRGCQLAMIVNRTIDCLNRNDWNVREIQKNGRMRREIVLHITFWSRVCFHNLKCEFCIWRQVWRLNEKQESNKINLTQ